MIVSRGKINIVQWGLILLSCFFSYVVQYSSAEIFIFLSCSVTMLASYVIVNFGKIHFRLTSYHLHILLFCFFCYISSFWAINARQSVGKANTLLEIFILMATIFLIVEKEKDLVNKMLRTIMWAGFFGVFYVIVTYGFSTILFLMASNMRIDNSLLNANSIGMMCAYSVLIAAYFIIYDGFKLWNLLLLPALLLVIVSSSRKAFFILIFGTVLLLILKNLNHKKLIRNIVKISCIIALSILLLYLLSTIPALEYIVLRFERLYSLFTGSLNVDQSALTRVALIKLGLDIFIDNPAFGVGIDNAPLLVAHLFHRDYYYLHNNYIELLADGGIVGFVLYYIFYFKIMVNMIRYRDFQNREFNIIFILMFLFLVIDFGAVTYFSKPRYFMLMIAYFMQTSLHNGSLYLTRE